LLRFRLRAGCLRCAENQSQYVLVSQRERRVEVYRRRENRRWRLDEHVAGGRLRLESLAIGLSVDDLYVDRVGVIVP
jgi:Uma2 family endonuclease